MIFEGYGYLWRRHTYRIEDGHEVEPFAASSDVDLHQPVMRHADATRSGSTAFIHSQYDTSGSNQKLNRRTSINEPIETVFEPSIGSHHHPSSSSQGLHLHRSDESPPTPPLNPAVASADAAPGRQHDSDDSRPISGLVSPRVSLNGRRPAGRTRYHSSGSGFTNPLSHESRWSRDQHYNGNNDVNANY